MDPNNDDQNQNPAGDAPADAPAGGDSAPDTMPAEGGDAGAAEEPAGEMAPPAPAEESHGGEENTGGDAGNTGM